MMQVKCLICNQVFEKKTYEIRRSPKHYCSKQCCNIGKSNRVEVQCTECSKSVKKKPCEIKRVENDFCSRSCSVTYQNKRGRLAGIRRSKLEVWLEDKLLTKYSSLTFHFNRKDTINSELDIYIPLLKLAVELNGIFHYEPIFGEEKLSQIQNNDNRKFQACLEKGIELCTIDTSGQKYFKPKSSQKFLDIICQIIESKLSP